MINGSSGAPRFVSWINGANPVRSLEQPSPSLVGDRRGSWPRPPAGTCRAALVRPPCGVALMIGGSEPQAFRGLSFRWLLRRPAAGPTGRGCIGPPQMLLSSWVVPAWHLRVSSLLAAPRITGRWAAAQLSTPEVRKQWGRGY